MAQRKKAQQKNLWYKDAVIYQLHVKAFLDSDGDGIGDFKGLKRKLDYLSDLGVTAIWILPFFPSPLKDDGYDIADYKSVNPQYGNLRDVKELIREAHKRDIKVIGELVLNHTSDQHPWFQSARKSERSKYRDFYVWSDTPERYQDARIIFTDFETSNWTWDPVAKAYFWHRFYSHQPDLNFENPEVRKTMIEIVDYWLEMGVDGLRLDAVPYLFEREGTNCENLPETHEFLKKIRKHIDKKFKGKMLLAEANQWPPDAVEYFGSGDECHMAFHFPLMPRMFMAVQMEDRFPIIDILESTPDIPENAQWATFLRNHDELTLEMVTDEERDYMYKMYARDSQARINVGIRRRLAPLLGNDRRKIELMNVLLFTLPGTPIVYYGDEIGMGDNFYLGDRNGVRTPMQWSADKNAGFSGANPQRLYFPVIIDPEYHYETINVENQSRNESSLLWWMRRIIAIRKKFKSFGSGSIQFLFPTNNKVLAFIRELGDEKILVTANLSRYPQAVELDLSEYSGFVPQEVFGGSQFPQIGESPYSLTFGPYGYNIFTLVPKQEYADIAGRTEPKLDISAIQDILSGKTKQRMENEVLPQFLQISKWFLGKQRKIDQLKIRDTISVGQGEQSGLPMLLIDVRYKEGLPETYLLPLAVTAGPKAKHIRETLPETILARLQIGRKQFLLYDGAYSEEFQKNFLQLVTKKRAIPGKSGRISGLPRKRLRSYLRAENFEAVPDSVTTGRTNTTIIFDRTIALKLFRRIEEGTHPELELGSHLEKTQFPNTPALLGEISYTKKGKGAESTTIALLREFVQSEEDAWKLSLDEAKRYFERILSREEELPQTSRPASLTETFKHDIPEEITSLIGNVFLEQMKVLGSRIAEFHLALAQGGESSAFRPEPLGYTYQIALSQFMSSNAKRVFESASKKIVDEELKEELRPILENRQLIFNKFKELQRKEIRSLSTRIHGDLQLREILHTGKDFMIADYEGDPGKSLTQRRLKRSPLFDVAGIIRSLHYAAYLNLFEQRALQSQDDIDLLETWADIWYKYSAAAFLQAYCQTLEHTRLVPKDEEAFATLLNAILLTRALRELDDELANRPQWALIPLRGIKELLALPEEKKEKEKE